MKQTIIVLPPGWTKKQRQSLERKGYEAYATTPAGHLNLRRRATTPTPAAAPVEPTPAPAAEPEEGPTEAPVEE